MHTISLMESPEISYTMSVWWRYSEIKGRPL